MKVYNNIFLDVDGTIIDPKIGITKSAKFALEKIGIKTNSFDDLEFFIGPPLEESFKRYYKFEDEKCELAIKYFREYFGKYGIRENTLYDGIIDILIELKKRKKRLVIATSKPTDFTEEILKNYDIYKYFDFISGSTLDNTRNKKADIIKYAIDNLNIKNPEDCIMIGDRKHDIIGAKSNQMDSIGVLYGYGTFDELKNESATYIINSVKDILKVLLDD